MCAKAVFMRILLSVHNAQKLPYAHNFIWCIVKKRYTVKARSHWGSRSLDLTIPAALCQEAEIKEGDVFYVELSKTNGDTEIIYKRIFK
jgi:hypothetical protein